MRTLGIFFSRSLLEKEESLILIDERGELFERKEVGGWKIEKCVLLFFRARSREREVLIPPRVCRGLFVVKQHFLLIPRKQTS